MAESGAPRMAPLPALTKSMAAEALHGVSFFTMSGEASHSLLYQFEKELRSTLEPVVSTFGFEWTRGNLDSNPREVFALFEAWRDLYAVSRTLSHLPWLAITQGKEGCLDLWVFLDIQDFSIRAELEGQDVAAWLEEQGHSELASALISPRDVATAVQSLTRALTTMFTVASGHAGSAALES